MERQAATAVRPATGSRFTPINHVVDRVMRELTGSEFKVWVCLWRDERDGTSRTGQSDIARRAGIHSVTVAQAIAKLKRMGLLTIVRRGGKRRGPSTYRVLPRST